MTPTGASHCAPSGATASSVTGADRGGCPAARRQLAARGGSRCLQSPATAARPRAPARRRPPAPRARTPRSRLVYGASRPATLPRNPADPAADRVSDPAGLAGRRSAGPCAILGAHEPVPRAAADDGDRPRQRLLRRGRVRLRQDPPDAAAAARQQGSRRARLLQTHHEPAPRLPLGQPARHHAVVADARLARRAGVRQAAAPLALSRGRHPERTLHTVAVAGQPHRHHVPAHRHRRAGAQGHGPAAHRAHRHVGGGAVPRVLHPRLPGHLDAQGRGLPRAAAPAAAARLRGRDAALARGAARRRPARQARPGRAPPHRPRVRLHAPGGAPRDDPAARRRDARGGPPVRGQPARSPSPTSTRATRCSSRSPIASSATCT